MSESEPSLLEPQGSSCLRPKAREALKAARAVFLTEGYDGASMDAIARVGAISKATLYAHFSSKAALFKELIRVECQAVNADLSVPDPRNPCIAEELRRLAVNHRRIFAHHEGLDIFRILIPVAPRFPELAQFFYDEGPGASITRIASYLGALATAGRLRVPHAELAARQFLALVTEDVKLTGTLALPAPASLDADQVLASGIEMFLDFYKAKPEP